MNILDLISLCPDIKTYIFSYLPDEAKYFCKFVCKGLDSTIPTQLNGFSRRFDMCKYVALYNDQNLINYWVEYTDRNGKYERIAKYITRYGYLDTLIWIHEKVSINKQFIVSVAAKYGQCNIISQFIDNAMNYYKRIITKAILYNHLNIVKLLSSNILLDDIDFVNTCCMSGNVEILEFLHNIGIKYTSTHVHSAALKGHLNILKYIDLSNPVGSYIWENFNNYILYSMEIYNWASSFGYSVTNESIDCAIYQKFSLCDYHTTYGFTFDQLSYIANRAIYYGRVPIMEWIYNMNPNILNSSFYNECNSTNMLKWLIKVNCPTDIDTFDQLVRYGLYDEALKLAKLGYPTNMVQYNKIAYLAPELAEIILKNEIIAKYQGRVSELMDIVSQLNTRL